MPQNHRYSKTLGRWVRKDTTSAFDYDVENKDSVATMISFFRWYPDYFLDLIRDENAKYGLELPQRIMLRVFARYRNVMITGVRGLTKTYVILAINMVEGVLFPGHKVRYAAPNQKQAASLAAATFHELEKSYPILTEMWEIKNDRQDMFRITTKYGSEFTMYAPRGSTFGAVVGEEIAQEGENAFDMDDFEANILPIVRDNRMVNQRVDTIHINQKHQYINNAGARTNEAYSKIRQGCLTDMLYGRKYEGYVMELSWHSALVSGLRDIRYFSDLKKTLSPTKWQRECCAVWTGENENPMITDESIAKSRVNSLAEMEHCGDSNAIYIVSLDVGGESKKGNDKDGFCVLKLTPYKTIAKRDKYRKQVVYVNEFPTLPTAYQTAKFLKKQWSDFCLDGGKATYIIIDGRTYGQAIVKELMKDLNDGLPTLCCINHEYADIEQPYALPVIYPVIATTTGGKDADGEMIEYIQEEWRQGNIELLVPDVLKGVEQYKLRHDIRDNSADRQIVIPYRKTEDLVQQIRNLTVEVSGRSVKERRKSTYTKRDMWTSVKYACRYARILEDRLAKENNKARSSWAMVFERRQLNNEQKKNDDTARGKLLADCRVVKRF